MDNIKDIESISGDELLSLYSTILEHITYLEQQILSIEEEQEETGGEEDE